MSPTTLVERILQEGIRSCRNLPQYLTELELRQDTLISVGVSFSKGDSLLLGG
jgi:hypothetical protein